VQTRFDLDTALVPSGDGRFIGRMDPGWWIERGPNGGYVAATILRGLQAAVVDPIRTPRSFTVHYLAPPLEGAVELVTNVERAGRQLSFVTGRLMQGDRLLALAQGAFAGPLAGPEFCDLQVPDVPPPEALTSSSQPTLGPPVPMRERYEMRWCIGGPPFSGAPLAVAGGWIRLVEPRPSDPLLLAALCDAWMPPLFSRLHERVGVPTIDLTVHFRAPAAPPAVVDADDGWHLVVFRSQVAVAGFVEEDGEVWSRSGRLLAHSRQLAIVLPVT
jgi:acyl-CoA thioesterase